MKYVEALALSQFLKAGIGDCRFIVIGAEFLEVRLIPYKPQNSEFLNIFTERNVDSLKVLARYSQLNQNLVSYRNSSKV